MMKKGIDISTYQGLIDWSQVKQAVDFVIIRAGYGAGNIDKRFVQNITACNKNKIPVGVYWFSYAYDTNMAIKEADYCINAISEYNVEYPVAFDFEYSSVDYANKMGRKLSKSDLVNIATAFLKRIEEHDYYAINYTNPDFLKRGFSDLTNRFDTWLAQWGVSTPTYSCGIWQYSSSGKLNGISGNVDMNISYNDYAAIIKNLGLNKQGEGVKIPDRYSTYFQLAKDYYEKAVEVIEGKYSTGTEREKLLKADGYDSYIVQKIVNFILG